MLKFWLTMIGFILFIFSANSMSRQMEGNNTQEYSKEEPDSLEEYFQHKQYYDEKVQEDNIEQNYSSNLNEEHTNFINNLFKEGLSKKNPDCSKMRNNGVECLACNIYHESRGEPISGQYMVAHVTIARAKNPDFGHTICQVVWEPSQFTWTNDGKTDKVYDTNSWRTALEIARNSLLLETDLDSNIQIVYGENEKSENVLWYHEKSIKPSWTKNMKVYAQIGNHIFYEKK